MAHTLMGLGALFGFLTVALGAFGAHILRARWSAEQMAWFQTGVQYQGLHSLAALVAGGLITGPAGSSALLAAAGWAFLAGILLFSGSLYLLAATGVRRWGAVTPFGGLAFLTGWALLLVAAWR
ncbi:putative conserved membrane protein [Candidatus Hydrogenisulfobacillus filiaventi]|uniref:Putative conserved membrane protein n=1 Tax=Candidatus Hydrogenisulfobacillus filiaventi TaxID=2707344 RepID=A0A6F8ZGQ2_9FIRM|nr:DUF423 domain-containing protein [Bacillota bacterium]CAB1128816.1 putative conserved membrane protein [Candidatus Hydrogenisulfobacillus filiaventi]